MKMCRAPLCDAFCKKLAHIPPERWLHCDIGCTSSVSLGCLQWAQGGALASASRYSPGQKEAGQDSIFGEEEEETAALAPYLSPFQAARCAWL